MKDVVIIGGGVAGISCAILIASAIEKEEYAHDKKIVLINYGNSDTKRAVLNNAIGFPIGIFGKEVMDNAIKQVTHYNSINYIQDKVIKIIGIDNNFEIFTSNSEVIKSKSLVISTGFRRFEIEGLDLNLSQHNKTSKSGRIQIENHNYKVRDNLWVCGNLAGISNQFSIASGSGAQVGVNIISEWAGEWKVVHDKKGK